MSRCFRFVLLSLMLFHGISSHAEDLTAQRAQFQQIEQLLAQNKPEVPELIAQLADYPLYPYLQYHWLKKNLEQTQAISAFLEKYPNSRYAELLRGKWLHYLAAQQRWEEVTRYYQATEAEDLQCLFQQAQYLSDKKDVALEAVKALWLRGEELPSACDYLLNALKSSSLMNSELVWERFGKALQHNLPRLAESLVTLLPIEQQASAKFWIRAHSAPELITTPAFELLPAAYQARIYAHAIQKLAHKNPSYATLLWDSKVKSFNVDPELRAQVELHLALGLAKNQLPGAYQRLLQLKTEDAEVKEWRLRTALLENNWAHVQEVSNLLSLEDQNLPRWQYWRARALAELGQQDSAQALFKQAASKRDYYSYLAADYVGLDYQLSDQPVSVRPELLTEFQASAEVQLIQELRTLKREHEAQAQWWYLIKSLDKEHIIAAAKIAQQWGWQHIAIFTIAKAEQWDDVNLRFPLFYQAQILQSAETQSLDPAVVFGLIRQESAFNQDAESPVGAKGLMQIMPSTGSQIAKELNTPLGSASNLYNPETNIQFGSYYYKKLLQQFNGHFALAAAAYNAGPHRVDSWLPKNRIVPADVWIETIPFKETRKYVTSVLYYAMVYQQRLHRNSLKMRDFVRDVLPL